MIILLALENVVFHVTITYLSVYAYADIAQLLGAA